MSDFATREEAEQGRWYVVWSLQVESHIILGINDVSAEDDVFSTHEDLDDAIETLKDLLDDYPDPVDELPDEAFIDAGGA